MASMKTYTAPDGTKYPLTEALHDISFRIYKSDKKTSVIGDPHACILAKGIRRDKDVMHAYVGSGKDAYVVFKGTGGRPDHAVHFTVSAAAAKARDTFDKKGSPPTQQITLRKPTRGRTLEARAAFQKARKAAIKDGAAVSRRGPQRAPRIVRLGVAHRPKPVITTAGVDTTPLNVTEE